MWPMPKHVILLRAEITYSTVELYIYIYTYFYMYSYIYRMYIHAI